MHAPLHFAEIFKRGSDGTALHESATTAYKLTLILYTSSGGSRGGATAPPPPQKKKIYNFFVNPILYQNA